MKNLKDHAILATPSGKTPLLEKRRYIRWLSGFEGSAREFKHMVGEHSTREGDQALQVEWQQNLNSIFNDILLLLRGCCAQQKYTVLDIQSPDCSLGYSRDFRCNALAHTVTPVCSNSRLLTYKSTCVLLLREIFSDLP